MAESSEKAPAIWGPVAGVAKIIGPYLVSQVEAFSTRSARHTERLGAVEVGNAVLKEEAAAYIARVTRLQEQFDHATGDERPAILPLLREAKADVCEVKIRIKALTFAQDSKVPPEQNPSEEALQASEHWIDRFRDLSRQYNEPWREDLLARALQRESYSPGSLTPRLLWLLGTLEQSGFEMFSKLLDLCSWLGHHQLIPASSEIYMRSLPEGVSPQKMDVGTLVSDIEDLGLVASSNVFESFPPELKFHASYDTLRYEIVCNENGLVVHGIILTKLGRELASLHAVQPNVLGQEFFDNWIVSIQKAVVSVELTSNTGSPGDGSGGGQSALEPLFSTQEKPLPEFVQESRRAQSLALEKPKYWEHLLTGELLGNKLAAVRTRYSDVTSGLVHARTRILNHQGTFDWVQAKFTDMIELSDRFDPAFQMLAESWGPLGQPGDALLILRETNRIADLANELCEWELDIRGVRPPERMLSLVNSLKSCTSDFLAKLESIPARLNKFFADNPNPECDLDLTVALDPMKLEGFKAEMEKLRRAPWLLQD